jgi:pimeloyl-ACP methyl ester carboxylesterase
MESIMSDISTNVRAAPPRPPAYLRAGVSALAAVSPGLAAAVLAPLFFKAPRRRRRSPEERRVLAGGQPFTLGGPGGRVAGWRWGAGPAVLLVHGWGGCAGQMTPLVAPLVAAGYTVLASDAPGHGGSAGWLASIPAFAAAIGRVAAQAGPLHGVVAHSMGGAAFSLAASRGLAARRVVYVGPPADALVWFHDYVRWLALPARVAASLRARSEAIAGERLDRLNATYLGPRLGAPLLVIHDRQDREVPLADGEQVARTAAGRLLVTEGLGHRRILRDPGVIAEAVRFLVDEPGSATAMPAA